MTAAAGGPRSRWWARIPSMEALFIGAFALLGVRLGTSTIGDNSMFVHIRTGVEMARGHGIPRHDPYTFTAHGHAWVVQSWLPSWTYGWLYRLGGLGWVSLEQGVLLGLVALLIARLACTGSALRTLGAASLAIAVGIGFWAPRPLLFGLLAFAVVVTIVERRANPWWFVPVVWVWVNSHGSFPLGLLWLGAVVVGRWIDERAFPRELTRYVVSFGVGLAVAALNPLGPRLLTFPIAVQAKSQVFRMVVEWRSPDFQTAAGLVTLAALGVSLLVLFRREVAWRDIVPVAGFVALGLLSLRNIPSLAIVLAPVLGRALAPASGLTVARASSVNRAVAALLVLLGLAFSARAAAGPGIETTAYPVSAVTWLDRNGYFNAPHHVAEQDTVGCYLDLRFGFRGRTFIDDRVDMFPVGLSDDYSRLLEGRPETLRILDRYGIDAVVWDKSLPLVSILRATGAWHETFHSHAWVVLVRS